MILIPACECTFEYGVKINGEVVPPYCDHWDSEDWSWSNEPWCYLSGGAEGKKCPGAIKSGWSGKFKSPGGEIYWTKDTSICKAAEGNRKSSKDYFDFNTFIPTIEYSFFCAAFLCAE